MKRASRSRRKFDIETIALSARAFPIPTRSEINFDSFLLAKVLGASRFNGYTLQVIGERWKSRPDRFDVEHARNPVTPRLEKIFQRSTIA